MSKQRVELEVVDGACCAPITEAALDPAQATDLAGMFKALGDSIRLRLLSRITSAPEGETCVCDLTAGDFDASGPTISHHLKVLREAGLIVGERRGTWVHYRPVPEILAVLLSCWTRRRWLTSRLVAGSSPRAVTQPRRSRHRRVVEALGTNVRLLAYVDLGSP